MCTFSIATDFLITTQLALYCSQKLQRAYFLLHTSNIFPEIRCTFAAGLEIHVNSLHQIAPLDFTSMTLMLLLDLAISIHIDMNEKMYIIAHTSSSFILHGQKTIYKRFLSVAWLKRTLLKNARVKVHRDLDKDLLIKPQ